MKKTVELDSPYPVEECKRRLEARMTSHWSVLVLAKARPLIGHFDGARFCARRRVWFCNAFRPHLSAELIAEDDKTRIRYRFSLRLLDKVVRIMWFSGLVLIGGGALIAAIIDAVHRQDVARVWPGIVISIFMLVFGSVVAGFERHIARSDRRFLADFVQKTLNAKHI